MEQNHQSNSDITTIDKENPRYPHLLKEINDAPLKIYALGSLPKNGKDLAIAIVGTRKATSYGKLLAKEIAKKLSELGITIVSGLAMGIDTAAHEGALETNGKTIAVLANGLDKIYPRQNENLAKKIIRGGGAMISEYQSGSPALPYQFLERNRIIAGLSIATIVIEAPEKSGSLATARLAVEYGREVFVFPGAVNNPNFFGSHKLIRDGARLVSSVEDILEDLQLNNLIKNKLTDIKEPAELSLEGRAVFEAIKNFGLPVNIDKIIEMTKLEPQITNKILAYLVIEGKIKETEKGYII